MPLPGAPGENPADIAARMEAVRTGAETGAELKDEFGRTIRGINAAGEEAKKNPEKATDKIAKAVEGIAKFFNDLGEKLVKIFGVEKMRKFAAGLKQNDWIRMWIENLLDSDGVQAKIITDTFPKIKPFTIEDPASKEGIAALRNQVKLVAEKSGKPRVFEEHILAISAQMSKEKITDITLQKVVEVGQQVVDGTEAKVETPTTDLFGVKGLKADNAPVTVPVATSEALTIKGKEKNDLAKISSKRITVLPSNKEFEFLYDNKPSKEMTISTADATDAREMTVSIQFEGNKFPLKLKTIVDAAAAVTGDSDKPVEIAGTGVFLKPVKAPVA